MPIRSQEHHANADFEWNTTVEMKLGSYVVLATAPSSTAQGDAIALIVYTTTD